MSLLSFIIILQLLLVTVYCSNTQKTGCIEWSLINDTDVREGDAIIKFNLPQYNNVTFRDVSVMFTCSDILVKGNGQINVRLHKRLPTYVQFSISLPNPNTLTEYLIEDDWMNHTCTFVMKPKMVSSRGEVTPIICQLLIKSYLGRFLSNCDREREGSVVGQLIIDDIKEKTEEGQIMLYFKNSPLDIITLYSYCPNNEYHTTKEEELNDNTLPLSPPGAQPSVMAVDFYPDCNNYSSPNGLFYITNCSLEVYSLCQEGRVLIKTIKPTFNKEYIECSPPRFASIKVVTDNLQLYIRIASVPVVCLLAVTILQTFIGVILLTIAMCNLIYWRCVLKKRKTKETEGKEEKGENEKLLKKKNNKKEEKDDKKKKRKKEKKTHNTSEEEEEETGEIKKKVKRNKKDKTSTKTKTDKTDKTNSSKKTKTRDEPQQTTPPLPSLAPPPPPPPPFPSSSVTKRPHPSKPKSKT